MTHYRAFMVETGDLRRSIRGAIEEAGQAITFTSVITVLGFSIVVRSSHLGIAHFGSLIAIAFSTALVADLLLLPALLALFGVDFRRARNLPLT